jgi:gamma-glutamylcyclotransferase (GGCT)/AIG2-like uncharacterized protein YtfP
MNICGMKEYLFAYGTLRRKVDLPWKEQLAPHWEYIGRGRVGARLYDLGSYPGAVEDKGEEVIGDLFLLRDADKVLRMLDKYEGPNFKRRKSRIRLSSGKGLNAWVYWVEPTPPERARIRQKDYLNYLNKKNIFR